MKLSSFSFFALVVALLLTGLKPSNADMGYWSGPYFSYGSATDSTDGYGPVTVSPTNQNPGTLTFA